MATSIIIPRAFGAGTRVRVSVNGVTRSVFRGIATAVDDDVLAALTNSGISFRLASDDTIGAGKVLIPGTGSRVRGTINGTETTFPVGVPFAASQADIDQITAQGLTYQVGANALTSAINGAILTSAINGAILTSAVGA